MLKKMSLILSIFCCLFVSGCSLNKKDLQEETIKLSEENFQLKENIREVKNNLEIYDFYNNITIENINSFVLVESKNILNSNTLYSNGVVIARNGYYYYVLTDYNAIAQKGMINYKVMDANAIVYSASLANVVDETTGLVILEVNVSGYSKYNMKTIELGKKSDLVAYFSNVKQLNKVELTNKIKTSSANYNDTSYQLYYLDDFEFDKGSLLINTGNQLCGIYLSKLEGFISSELIKEVLYTTYSLVL